MADKVAVIAWLRKYAGAYAIPGVDNNTLANWLAATPAPAPLGDLLTAINDAGDAFTKANAKCTPPQEWAMDLLADAIGRLRNAAAVMAATPAPAPAGWKLVPVEPTPEMLRAAAAEWLKHGEHAAKFPLAQGFESPGICPSQRIDYSRATHVYRAMLAAANAMTEVSNG